VGGVLTGLEEGDGPTQMNPRVGDILVTTDDVEDGRQHIWEAFPGRPGETTVYLFFYDRAERVGPGALMQLYARFFATVGRYKRGDWKLARPTFGYIPGWSRLTPAPRSPSPRVVLVGDAAARQSPLTYCGFGATLRSLAPASDAIARLVRHGEARDSVVDDAPVHAATGALAHMIASPPRDPHALNALLDAAFGTLHEMGQEPFAALLRDEMNARDMVRFLQRTSVKFPGVYPAVFRVLGVRGVSRWGAGIARGVLG
jgi:lycopene cyclase CruA